MPQGTCGHPTNDGGECKNPAGQNGRCWLPSHNPDSDADKPGRESKFTDERKAAIIDAAEMGTSVEGCARSAGIGVSTLYDWLDQYPEFSEAFNRARAKGEMELVEGARNQDPKWLLERSYGYVKTEKREITGEDGGPVEVNFSEEVVETPWGDDE